MQRKTLISVTTGFPMDAREAAVVHLRIEDDASGECLVDVEIPDGQWWRLVAGLTQHHMADVSPHLDRIGKTLRTEIVPVPKEVARYRGDEAAARVWAVGAAVEREANEVDVRLTNSGWEAIYRWWEAPASDATDRPAKG